jgi:flagellar motor component MotA
MENYKNYTIDSKFTTEDGIYVEIKAGQEEICRKTTISCFYKGNRKKAVICGLKYSFLCCLFSLEYYKSNEQYYSQIVKKVNSMIDEIRENEKNALERKRQDIVMTRSIKKLFGVNK